MTCAKSYGTPRRVAMGPVVAELLPRASYDVAYTPSSTVAGFAFEIQTGLHAFAGDRTSPFLTMPGSMALTPQGCDIRSRSDTGGEYLTVTISPGQEGRFIEDFETHRLQQYSNGAPGPSTIHAMALRRQLLACPHEGTHIQELAVQFFEAALGARPTGGKPASSLTRPRLQRLHDLVEARFTDMLSVADMAAELGLSVSYFIRAFKAATGMTPHAYLLDRRLEHARQLLWSQTPIAQVAGMSGFSSQAHLTTCFQQKLGLTPKRFRDLAA